MIALLKGTLFIMYCAVIGICIGYLLAMVKLAQ